MNSEGGGQSYVKQIFIRHKNLLCKNHKKGDKNIGYPSHQNLPLLNAYVIVFGYIVNVHLTHTFYSRRIGR